MVEIEAESRILVPRTEAKTPLLPEIGRSDKGCEARKPFSNLNTIMGARPSFQGRRTAHANIAAAKTVSRIRQIRRKRRTERSSN